MGIVSILINRYGGDMVEAFIGPQDNILELFRKNISDSIKDLGREALSGAARFDLSAGSGSIEYVSDDGTSHSDHYQVVEVMEPESHSGYILVAGTDEMPAEAVMFCPEGKPPLDYARDMIRDIQRKTGLTISCSGPGWIRTKDDKGNDHLWQVIHACPNLQA